MYLCMCTCALFCLGIYLSSLVAAPKAKEEDAQDDDGKKKKKKGNKEKAKKGGDKSDPKMSAAVIPDQEKDGGIAKPGRTKKPTKKTERIVEVTGDDDVEGGGT